MAWPCSARRKSWKPAGTPALAQETEEWSHLQYFAADADTALILLSANQFDADRMAEVARAAQQHLAPDRLGIDRGRKRDPAICRYATLRIPRPIPERYASIVYSIPGELFSAARAAALGSPYFRDFEGGRKVRTGLNGASQISLQPQNHRTQAIEAWTYDDTTSLP